MKKTHYEIMLAQFPSLLEWKTKIDGGAGSKIAFTLKDGSEHRMGVLHNLKFSQEYFSNNPLRDADGAFELSEEWAAMLAVFRGDGEHIYKMGREFSEILMTLKLDLPASHLPKNNQIECIEFAENQRFLCASGLYAHQVYVYVTDEKTETIHGTKAVNLFTVFSPLFDEKGNLTSKVDVFTIPFESLDQTFEDAVQKADRYSSNPGNMALLRFVLNAYIYIHNDGEPDMREFRAPRPPKVQRPKQQRCWLREHENESLIDMILVGFDFKKSVIYNIDSTSVMGHWRWQPHGTQRSKVKLIFIDEHVRTYKKESESYDAYDPNN